MSRRICIVRHRDYELVVRREAEALVEAGYEVDVVCLRAPGEPFVSRENGVRLVRLPLVRERGGVLRYVFDYLAFIAVAAICVAVLHVIKPYAAVQANTMPDLIAAVTVVPRLLGAKAVVFMKEPSPELADMTFGRPWVTRVFGTIERVVLRYSQLTLTVTEQLKERYVERGADGSKITVVLNGPDPRHLLEGDAPPPADRFTLVCHGTIEDRYGHATLLEAVRLAAMDVPGLHLVVTGSGSGVDDLVAAIDEFDLRSHVSYLGLVPFAQLRDVLRSAHVGVVPMRSNAYSNLVHTNKMFEYVLLGKPVIATRLRSVAAYFGDDSIAFVPPDDPKAMAVEIVDLYRRPERREALAAKAADLYRELGWERQREIYTDAFARLLGGVR